MLYVILNTRTKLNCLLRSLLVFWKWLGTADYLSYLSVLKHSLAVVVERSIQERVDLRTVSYKVLFRGGPLVTVVNPRRTCAARVTVVGSVCLCVC